MFFIRLLYPADKYNNDNYYNDYNDYYNYYHFVNNNVLYINNHEKTRLGKSQRAHFEPI